MNERNRIYGPVPSRRLGLSLGIDIVDYKHCTLDCVYCQLKETTEHDMVRTHSTDATEIIEQVRARITRGPRPDFLTLAGSGEPTLCLELGNIIAGLKSEFDIPVALITNGTLFSDPAVRTESAMADVVLPSLDAWDQESFERLNRPCPGLDFNTFMDGMVAFRDACKGEIWLEIMILKGISDSPAIVTRLADAAARIRPDRIQINTPVRPPSCSWAMPADYRTLVELAQMFKPAASVAADFPDRPTRESSDDIQDSEILEMITRRPCTAIDVATGLDASAQAVEDALKRLIDSGLLTSVQQHGKTYFKLPE